MAGCVFFCSRLLGLLTSSRNNSLHRRFGRRVSDQPAPAEVACCKVSGRKVSAASLAQQFLLTMQCLLMGRGHNGTYIRIPISNAPVTDPDELQCSAAATNFPGLMVVRFLLGYALYSAPCSATNSPLQCIRIVRATCIHRHDSHVVHAPGAGGPYEPLVLQ